MHLSNIFKLLFQSLLVVLSILSNHAYAENTEANCLDNIHLVCISETFSHQTISNQTAYNISRYTITNNSEMQIYAFGVTNTNGRAAFLGEELTGWESTTLSEIAWDETQKILRFNNNPTISTPWVTGTNDINGYHEIGQFAALFGPSVNEQNQPLYVNFYWNSGNTNALVTGVTLDQFYFNGLPESNFVALDINGNLIASSLTTAASIPDTTSVAAVPEPKTYFMLLIGLILIQLNVQAAKQKM